MNLLNCCQNCYLNSQSLINRWDWILVTVTKNSLSSNLSLLSYMSHLVPHNHLAYCLIPSLENLTSYPPFYCLVTLHNVCHCYSHNRDYRASIRPNYEIDRQIPGPNWIFWLIYLRRNYLFSTRVTASTFSISSRVTAAHTWCSVPILLSRTRHCVSCLWTTGSSQFTIGRRLLRKEGDVRSNDSEIGVSEREGAGGPNFWGSDLSLRQLEL